MDSNIMKPAQEGLSLCQEEERKKVEVAPQDLLNEVLTSIEETEQKLKTLKMQKKDIEKQIEAKEMAELYAIVKEKNMSIEDVKTKLGAE